MVISRASAPIIRGSPPLDLFSTTAKRRQADWLAAYTLRQQQLGNTATLVNFGDPNAGALDAATFTGMKFNASGLSPIWTPSAALSAWSTPFDLALPANWQGRAPILTFNGTSEDMTTPDAAYWSRVAGAFSVGAWVKRAAIGAIHYILAKWDETTGSELREWQFRINIGDYLELRLCDESVAGSIIASRRSTNTIATGTWTHCVVTRSSADLTHSGITLYINGVAETPSGGSDVGYVDVEDLATLPRVGSIIGTGGTASDYFSGAMAGGPYCPFFVQAELTAEQVYNLYARERLALGV